MLDPQWTPRRGYSHAADLLAIAEQAETLRAAAAVCPCGGPLDTFGHCERGREVVARMAARRKVAV
jgi:hypothetical protein